MPPPDKQKRPVGRPRPVRGSSRGKGKVTASSGLKAAAERAVDKVRDVGSKSRPAPAFGVSRLPKTRAGLYARYGLVFDPTGEDNPVTQRELDSLIELYRRSTGQDLDSKGDIRKALESVGLIGKPEKRLTKPAENLFASAADALDWFDRNAGPYVSDQAILGGGRRAVGRVFREVGDFPVPVPRAGGLFPRVSSSGRAGAPTTEQTTVGDVVGPVAGAAGRGIRSVLKTAVTAPSLLPDVSSPSLLGFTPEARIAGAPPREPRSLIGDIGRSAGGALTVPFQTIADAPVPTARSFISLTPEARIAGAPGEMPSLSEAFRRAQMSPQFGGLTEIEQEQILNSVLGGFDNEEQQAGEFIYLMAAAEGVPVAELNAYRQALNLGPLTEEARNEYLYWARQWGWDMADPSIYTDAEIVRRAFNKPTPQSEAYRSTVRQVREYAAAPMAIPAIVSAVGSGDPKEMENMLRFVFSPYTGLYEDYQKRGLQTALSAFAQEYPVDFALLAIALPRIIGRFAGAGARFAAAQNAMGMFAVRSPVEGSRRARLGEFAATNRPVTVETPVFRRETEGIVGELQSKPAAIGYTGKNLLDTFLKEMYAGALSLGMRSEGRVGRSASYLATRRAARAVRRAQNMSDDVGARMTREITSLVHGLSSDQLVRLAIELISSRVSITGSDYSVAEKAAFFASQAADARRQAEGATGSTARDLRRQAARFDRQAAFYQRVADTPLDNAVIESVRDAVRQIGDDNDAIVAVIIDAIESVDTPNALQRTVVPYGTLRVGDRINVGVGDDVVPARVLNIDRAPDGRLNVQYQNILNPRDVQTLRNVLGANRVEKLRPSVNAAKYVRQFIEWDSLIRAFADDLKKAENVRRREAAAEANKPRRRLEKLDFQRRGIQAQLKRLAEELEGALLAGNQSLARRKRRSIEVLTRRLLQRLREMERLARAEGLADLADDIRTQRLEVVQSRGVRGRFARAADELVPSDEAAVREAGLLRRLRGGQFTQRNISRVRQPEARRLLEEAERGERRAGELRRFEEELLARRAEAPTSAQASRARRRAEEAREDVGVLTGQVGEASRAPSGLLGALDALQARLVFVSQKGVAGKRARMFRQGTSSDRVFASRTIRRLREKANKNRRFTDQDLRDLEAAEAALIKVERRLDRTAGFERGRAPDGFGETTVPRVVGDLETAPRRQLEGAAREREAVAERAEEVVAAREAAPPLRREPGEVEDLGVERLTITDVRKRRRQIEAEVKKKRRDAIRIIERGRPLVSASYVTAAINAAGDSIAFKVDLDKPVYFTIKDALKQTKDEFIAQAELYGTDPVLYLGTRVGSFGGPAAKSFRQKEIDFSRTAGISNRRLQEYSGQAYAAGVEDMRRAWQNLLTDATEIRTALEFQTRLRDVVEMVGVRIDSVTPKEAAALNKARDIVDPRTADVVLTEAEAVVYNARQFVPVRLGKGKDQRVGVGVAARDKDSPVEIFERDIPFDTLVEAGGDYILVPRYLYDAMRKQLADIDYVPDGFWGSADKVTKVWRNFTLNVFPRTGFANLMGSIVLGLTAGAGPKSFYLAYKFIRDPSSVPGPTMLRQRYALELTSPVDFQGIRGRLPQRRVEVPGTGGLTVSAESPFAAMAWWMNNMRRFNGIAEDFGRLAVWYSRAVPEARRVANDGFFESWANMRRLSDDAQDVLQKFADNDPEYIGAAQRFVDASFEWLGDLHQGGKTNTILRTMVPFQQWYRHIIRLTFITMPTKYPGRNLFLNRLAALGADYQREHGVLAPWFADALPLWIEEKITEDPNTKQLFSQSYIAVWRSTQAWPYTTAAEAAGGNAFELEGYGYQALVPIYKNFALIAYSMLSGTAQESGTYTLTEEARNAFDQTISTYSMEGLGYILKLLWRMVPGSTIALGMGARSAESGILFRDRKRLLKGPDGPLPPEALPPDMPGRDIAQLKEDFSAQNLIVLLSRMLVGGGVMYAPGEGWVSNAQFKRMRRNMKSEFSRNEKAEPRIIQIWMDYHERERKRLEKQERDRELRESGGEAI